MVLVEHSMHSSIGDRTIVCAYRSSVWYCSHAGLVKSQAFFYYPIKKPLWILMKIQKKLSYLNDFLGTQLEYSRLSLVLDLGWGWESMWSLCFFPPSNHSGSSGWIPRTPHLDDSALKLKKNQFTKINVDIQLVTFVFNLSWGFAILLKFLMGWLHLQNPPRKCQEANI